MGSNKKHAVQDQEDDDSWEVKAFEEDTANILLGATWPPRCYNCTFCGREFRSAQALGGHMNVHRRDRARLHHQAPPGGSNKPPPPPPPPPPPSSVIPPEEFITNGGSGLCLLYSLPNPTGVVPPTSVNSCVNPPCTLLSISPWEANSIVQPCPSSMNFRRIPRSMSSSACSDTEHSASITNDNNNQDHNSESKKESAIEEIDLELRLGRRSSSTP